MLFFGVPNGGIKTAYWMPIVDRKPNKKLITSPEPNNDHLKVLLQNVNKRFCFPDSEESQSTRRRKVQLLELVNKVTFCFTTKLTLSVNRRTPTGSPDILVTRDSAAGHFSPRVQHTAIPFHESHTDLPEFSSSYHDHSRTIEHVFVQWRQEALVVIRRRFMNQGLSYHIRLHMSTNQISTALKVKEDDAYFMLDFTVLDNRLPMVYMLLRNDDSIDMIDNITGSSVLIRMTASGIWFLTEEAMLTQWIVMEIRRFILQLFGQHRYC